MQYWDVNANTNSDPMTSGPHLSSYGPGDRFTIIKERLPSTVIHTKSKQHILGVKTAKVNRMNHV
jgi:hypothetical protein